MGTLLKKEIEALKNQAKARGHSGNIKTSDLLTKAYETPLGSSDIDYVYKDLFKSLMFVIFVLTILLIISIRYSDISVFIYINNLVKHI